MNVEAGFQLDIVGALERRLWLMVSIIGGVFLAAYWVAMALPNFYSSAAVIFVEPQAISQELVEAGVGEADLTQRLNLMSAEILSRPRLSRVIDELGLYEEESEEMLRVEIIEMMRERISVDPVIPELGEGSRGRDEPELNTFVVSFLAQDAKTSADVAQRLANDFVNEHIEARVAITEKGLAFIDVEVGRLSERAKAVQALIAQVKDDNAGSLPEDLPANQRLLEHAMSELRQAERERDTAAGNHAFWESQVMVAAATADPRDELSPLRRMQLLELRLAEFRSKGFTDKHPDILHTEQEIAEVRSQIEAEGSDDEDREGQPVSIAQQNALAQQQLAAMNVAAAQKEIERLAQQRDEIETRIFGTPRVTEKLEGLAGEAEQLIGSLRDFSNRRLAASVRVDLERRQLGEQFRILEPAYPPLEASSPNRPLILIMGFIGGVALALGAAIALEGADSSFHAVRDLQTTISIPVLAAIPNIVLESDLVLQRRRRLRHVLAASFVVVVTLMGGAATYMYVNGMPGWLSAVLLGEEPEEEVERGVFVGWSSEDRA
jgi:succinoglycan biosynthesis transport protein ExoP